MLWLADTLLALAVAESKTRLRSAFLAVHEELPKSKHRLIKLPFPSTAWFHRQ